VKAIASRLARLELAVGAHSITAVFDGSTDFNTSTSEAVSLTVNTAKTATKLTSTPNPSNGGQSVTNRRL